MQIILLERITRTGNLGDVVNVKAGFARNFLFPTGKAKPANKANIAEFEAIRAELESKEAVSKEKAQRIYEKLNDTQITISANASEEGKLFGSVGVAEIAEALDSDLGVSKRNISLSESIRNIGEYKASIELWSDVVATITVIVIASQDSE